MGRFSDELRRRAARYAGKPLEYARRHLAQTLTPKQEEILSKLQTPPFRVLARSANTQGKTRVGAIQASYFYDSFDPSETLITAPTKVNVRDLAFKELRGVRLTSAGFQPKDTRLESSPQHYVYGKTSSTGDGFQGSHAAHLGIWMDEATGIDAVFSERAETMFGGHEGHWWLKTFNPNDVASNCFVDEESGLWHTVELNALDHPNIAAELAGLPPLIPAAIRLATVRRRIAGECLRLTNETIDPVSDFLFDNVWYRPQTARFEAQILGRWPLQEADTVWSPALFDSMPRHELNLQWGLAGGCDVARFGDDATCIAIRRGPSLMSIRTLHHRRTGEIADELRRQLLASARDIEEAKRAPVYIDDTGGWGAGVLDAADGWNWIAVNAASKSPSTQYLRMRSYLWFNLRTIADAHGFDHSRLDADTRRALRRELCSVYAAIREHDNTRYVEPKSRIKKRIGKSPDIADGVNLCYLVF